MLSKIAFHINSLGKGGAERVIANLSGEFVKMNIDVVIATEWTASDEYPLAEGIRRTDVGLTKSEESLSRGKKLKLRKRKLHDFLLDEKPDVLISFTRNSNYRAVMASKNTGVPVIFSVRSDPNTDYGSFIHKTIGNHLYKKAKGGVFQTKQALDFFHKSIGEKSVVILNPLNEHFLDLPDVSFRNKEIVTAGRFNEAKDQLVLIKAFERIMDKFPDYNLKLYGDRSEDNTFDIIEAYVKERDLSKRVLFMGNSASLWTDLINASVFVLSSKYEGMPNALMEAMAMGIPVVSTDCPCGGPEYLINDGENGYLVPVGDDKAMADKISFYLNDMENAEKMGKKAKEIAKATRPEVIAEQWLSYIEKVIK